jgi:hypothetical protein
MKRIILLFVIIAMLISIHASVFFNKSCDAFGNCENTGDTSNSSGVSSASDVTMGDLIVNSGFEFKMSKSNFVTFLAYYEKSEKEEPSFINMNESVNKCISHLQASISQFSSLCSLASQTPYNEAVIEKLKDFNYSRFMNEHGLTEEVFLQLRSYLEIGDVKGVYNQQLMDFNLIQQKLTNIQSALESSTLPLVEAVWELNELYTRSTLFGQYTAEVFYNL